MTEGKRGQGRKEWKGIGRGKDGEGCGERTGVTCRARLAVSEARPQSKGQREVKRLRAREREEIERGRQREGQRRREGRMEGDTRMGKGVWKGQE